ncbi:MAG: indolepyruvate ferredoxin oxidoreductase subunit alpha [Chloroflexi bacterium]|nr:indolepyruvate ferredoxin oxidoreductase subunit alpha [Chloroflexota bacterium]
MNERLITGKAGERLLALGNEAFARGAIEAGVRLATGYPGTPSTEIMETLIAAAPTLGMSAFWSVNEKVALDVGTGAAFSGARTLVVVKHVGLNVAADSLLQLNLVDVAGGLVIITVDDPGGISSNNEQDNRWYGKMAEIPTFEPANLNEAREMTRQAFDLSEQLKVPVLIRSVTRLAHMTGELQLGPVSTPATQPYFDSTKQWTPFPPLKPHGRLQDKLSRAQPLMEASRFDWIEGSEQGRFGVAAAGFAYNYAREVVEMLGLGDKVVLLKTGSVNPLPKTVIHRFLNQVDELLVVEDVAPFLEESLLAETAVMQKTVKIHGRRSGNLPGIGETIPDVVAQALGKLLGVASPSVPQTPLNGDVPLREDLIQEIRPLIPNRQISFCSGCSHRSTYFALIEALNNLGMDDAIVVGDIGCYTLGFFPPFNILQTMTSMGASMGTAAAMAQLNPTRKVIAVIGDSTMYHGGMSGLLQIAHQGLPVLVLVMDNSVTGSTGQQPHPGSWQYKDERKIIPIEEIGETFGFKYVKAVGAFQLKRLTPTLEEALTLDGPAMIVSREACALHPAEIGRRVIRAVIDPALCDACLICVDGFGCPAFVPAANGSGKIEVLTRECTGCAACTFVCPQRAISFVRQEVLAT